MMLHFLLHNLCCLSAIIGSIGYIILLIIGSPTSTWCMPLLVAATICKLFATNNYSNYDDDSRCSSTQKQQQVNPICCCCWLSTDDGRLSTMQKQQHHNNNLQRRWQLRRMLRERYYRRLDENYWWRKMATMMTSNEEDDENDGVVDDRTHVQNTPSPARSDRSDGSGGGIAMLPSPGISFSRYQRFKKYSIGNGRGGRMRQDTQPQSLSNKCITTSNTTLFLSVCLILLPNSIYFLKLFKEKISQSYEDEHDPTESRHMEIANTIGKFSASFLCLLLFPLSQYNSLFLSLGMSEIHAIGLHIVAGTGAILAGLGHGMYYIVIWLKLKGYRRYSDVFPGGECWKQEMILEFGLEKATGTTRSLRLLHNGEEEEEEEEDCQSKFINLLGVLGGTFFLLLGLFSMYSLRRRHYQLFYNVHVVLSLLLLFVLVMHYNKMIYYIAPGLLHYMALGLPIAVESKHRLRKHPGGVHVKTITCIPDSGGCVDIEFSLSGVNDYDDNDVADGYGDVVMNEDEGVILSVTATNASVSSNEEGEKQRGYQSSLASACLSSNSDYQFAAKYNRSIHETVGKYLKLHVPELSSQSHPFTVLAKCRTPKPCRQQQSSIDSFHILFRPIGSFTTTLSKRLQALTLQSPPESCGRVRTLHANTTCPAMFVNGMRCNTVDMFHKATATHDKVIILAGGVGIVPYISLIHAIRQHSMTNLSNMIHAKKREETMMNDESRVVKNHLQLIYNDGEVENDDEEEYLEGGLERSQDIEHSEFRKSELFGEGSVSDSSLANKTKCIDVHWMSRDDGLIRHVLKNYLEPYCHVGVSKDGRHCNPLSAWPISINFVVHHTSLDPNRTESDCKSNIADEVESEPTTWVPNEKHSFKAMKGEHAPAYYEFPTSFYEGNRRSPMHNIIPTVTYASIVFGGMWIVNYCYTNIQSKKVFQTRPIAVLGITIFTVVASLISYGMILLVNFFHSKLLFAYAKLDAGGHTDHDVSNREIEFGPVSDTSVGRMHFADHDVPSDSGNPTTSATPLSSSIIKIRHKQGRPDLEAILKDALKKKANDDKKIDVGIFMCGPKAMSDSVWKAIKGVEHRETCCSQRTPIAVYQEVFEL